MSPFPIIIIITVLQFIYKLFLLVSIVSNWAIISWTDFNTGVRFFYLLNFILFLPAATRDDNKCNRISMAATEGQSWETMEKRGRLKEN